ncbi:SPOSA6832_03395 [Sporobolomyces salmonicolor]|uniref:SPOSA6832_03395-mRNA-1:cds n=1 Tax=Sporidiobolus salmonicolor TaxID=5005 RepID=A0A0D6EPH7_SPOSA|nr:SPOSA6832_03395 [Sporobolomyces salmonicolor]
MFSPTIMLLLGGFTLAAALSKQNIDKVRSFPIYFSSLSDPVSCSLHKVLATKVLSLAGTRPRSVLFAYMCVACFASMWISNVAAPVLCYSLIQPILRTLPSKSPFSKSLILGIALASNIGGMASPISSPQNLIALEYMNPPISWLGWFAVSIPVSFTCVVLIWMILLWSYRTGKNVVINPVRVNKEPWTRTQWFVALVTMATIALWCVESRLSWLFGDMGIIAILPIVSFYGSGVLRKADFDHSPWSIVFLAMGGIGLGKAVLSSGLLDDIDRVIERIVLGLDIWPILALFSLVVLVIATFISHTYVRLLLSPLSIAHRISLARRNSIAAVLVIPIAAQIGAAMEAPHPRLLIFATSLICSAGMGLPVSGFPNLQAISLEDDVGQPYLQPIDFFKNGVPASVVVAAIVITMGYGIMRLLGL